jgi:Flp pilus assembly protein TadD
MIGQVRMGLGKLRGWRKGYSYMLRGNLSAARRKFEQAYSLDPTNPIIINNLELLNGSRRFIERPPNNQP